MGWGSWLGGGSGEGRNQCELLVMRSQMAPFGRLAVWISGLVFLAALTIKGTSNGYREQLSIASSTSAIDSNIDDSPSRLSIIQTTKIYEPQFFNVRFCSVSRGCAALCVGNREWGPLLTEPCASDSR